MPPHNPDHGIPSSDTGSTYDRQAKFRTITSLLYVLRRLYGIHRTPDIQPIVKRSIKQERGIQLMGALATILIQHQEVTAVAAAQPFVAKRDSPLQSNFMVAVDDFNFAEVMTIGNPLPNVTQTLNISLPEAEDLPEHALFKYLWNKW